MTDHVLTITGLKTYFFTRWGVVRAVDEVDLDLPAGRALGLVGESGCGKSVTALSILRLVPAPRGRIVSGEIVFGGRDLLTLDEADMRAVRGGEIGMIFQEPMTSLNPVFTIGAQIIESLRLHKKLTGKAARQRTIELLQSVGMPDPDIRMGYYPHQLSGGMRQRVMIAMALAGDPLVLIADEPTTALDVTIQAQILELISRLQHERSLAMILITHDLGVVAQTTDRVAVMYAGKVIEETDTEFLFSNPKHPYTQGLFLSLPTSDSERLRPIPGSVPNPLDAIPGCTFHPRCPRVMAVCRTRMPPPLPVGTRHVARCWLYE